MLAYIINVILQVNVTEYLNGFKIDVVIVFFFSHRDKTLFYQKLKKKYEIILYTEMFIIQSFVFI